MHTRLAARSRFHLRVISWTPRPDVSANFGGRVEQFTLNSSNAPGELSLTDVVPRADVSWTMENDWVLRVSAEREAAHAARHADVVALERDAHSFVVFVLDRRRRDGALRRVRFERRRQ